MHVSPYKTIMGTHTHTICLACMNNYGITKFIFACATINNAHTHVNYKGAQTSQLFILYSNNNFDRMSPTEVVQYTSGTNCYSQVQHSQV